MCRLTEALNCCHCGEQIVNLERVCYREHTVGNCHGKLLVLHDNNPKTQIPFWCWCEGHASAQLEVTTWHYV